LTAVVTGDELGSIVENGLVIVEQNVIVSNEIISTL
jgi:hypothetical protein